MLSALVLKIIVLVTLLSLTLGCGLVPLKFYNVTDDRTDRVRRRRYRLLLSLLSCFAAGVFLATCLLDLLPHTRSQLTTALSDLNITTEFPVAEFVLVFGLFFILAIEQFVLTLRANAHPHERQRLLEGSPGAADAPKEVANAENVNIETPLILENDEEEATIHVHSDPSSHSLIRSFFLLLALSVHAVFEGLAVGLQSDGRQILQIFAALAIHKGVIAFSLALSLVSNRHAPKAVIRSSVFFAVASPVGIAAGIVVSSLTLERTTSGIIDGVLQGIASGTFLFVVFFEILPHEFNSVVTSHSPRRMLKVLFLIIGFAAITLVIFLEP